MGENSGIQSGPRNPNWRGGRTQASHGYVLVRVGKAHHLADVRGYAYEHRIVAERVIGRRLRPGEQVHHRNGVKDDNRPENLEVVPSLAHHMVRHRTVGQDRRLPGEPNANVECRCGCGESFPRYDESGRPRIYVSGHNPMPAPTSDGILRVLGSGPASRHHIARHLGKDVRAVAVALSRLRRAGRVEPVRRGVWRVRRFPEVSHG